MFSGGTSAEQGELPPNVGSFLEQYCYDCHDDLTQKGGLDLDRLSFDLEDRETFAKWVLLFDRVKEGEMPPEKKARPQQGDLDGFLGSLETVLVEVDRERIEREGRARVRRLNRFEYENTLRKVLNAPWLMVADRLPEDGMDHLFNKVGERLDVSHVQMMKFLETAEYALRTSILTAAFPTQTNKFYAREEPRMRNYLKYRFGQTAATRSAIPLIGITPQPEVIRGNEPLTVGDADPELREQEAFGFVSGTYTATTKYDFTNMRGHVPIDGRYRIRMKTYTFLAGPNGASGGSDHGLTGGNVQWWRPSRTVAFRGTRSEPVTLYALSEGDDSRWLTSFDSQPDPTVIEREVVLREGEAIRPDATRLVRTRPGWKGNPNATKEGVPGLAFNWLEVEGPLHESWPPLPYKAVFADMPFEIKEGSDVKVLTDRPIVDARRLLKRFAARVLEVDSVSGREIRPFMKIFRESRRLGMDFTDSMIAACSTLLCSSEFLYMEMIPGPLDQVALAQRMALFLWNSPPDKALLKAGDLHNRDSRAVHVERMLNDPLSEKFVHAFLDYWLDLKEINANTPDAELYPDYYLDDWLTESALQETRLFFKELIRHDLPVRYLVDSDFTFANERLAELYGFPVKEGVTFRRTTIPEGNPRGGLLTQASVLRVTANGTTTSPVIRGAWVMERVMGVHIPPPPSGVAAIEPDTRGATTIREQLDKHREAESCNACHKKFDPAGFALESFDIAGGWRNRYRAVGKEGDPAEGIGKNGHLFQFNHAQAVDSSGVLADGRAFEDVIELKQHLANDPRSLARNLVNRLIVYATGAPVTFADRVEVEAILDRSEETKYGVRNLIREVVLSSIFEVK